MHEKNWTVSMHEFYSEVYDSECNLLICVH